MHLPWPGGCTVQYYFSGPFAATTSTSAFLGLYATSQLSLMAVIATDTVASLALFAAAATGTAAVAVQGTCLIV